MALKLGPEREDGTRIVTSSESPGGSVGFIWSWQALCDQADDLGKDGEDRAEFLHYSALESFQGSAERHLIVSLNSEWIGAHAKRRRKRVLYVSPRQALAIVGHSMSMRNRFVYEARDGSTTYLPSQAVYRVLAQDLMPTRLRSLNGSIPDETTDNPRRTAGQILVEAVFERVEDLLRARDGLFQAGLRPQSDDSISEMLFFVRAIVGFVPALFDTVAVIARHVFEIEGGEFRDTEVSLRNKDFRKRLRHQGAATFAEAASNLAPLLAVVWAFRNPTLHREGISGFPLHQVDLGFPGIQSNRIEIDVDQLSTLKNYCRLKAEDETKWGLDGKATFGHDLALEPFAHRLVLKSLQGLHELCSSLAFDRNLPEINIPQDESRATMLRRLRWLTGLPDKNMGH